MDYAKFINPPPEYGEVSFFWWQGDPVTREKLTWILDQLEAHHICGLQINYAHGDSGGRTYGLTMPSQPHPLSDEWWELVEWFEREAKRRGMAISLSDYTLSTPGQQSYTDEVMNAHPEFTGQMLFRPGYGEQLNPEYYDLRELCDTPSGPVIAARIPFSLNPMHPGLGKAIADCFYGAFERHMPGECGTGINFFFFDELGFNVRGRLWSDNFAAEFERRKGYDVTPLLGDLFDDTGDRAIKTRLDYYDVVVQLSEEGYFKPIYDWHQQRGMTFGCDHGGRGRDVTEFGDYFRTMKWNQGPGNDQPRLACDIIKNKVSSSIAHMYERPRTWLEGFYSSGWQTSSADVADAVFRNFATGQNLLSLHGLYYSMHGSMWEWAPPCNHYHMPYWPEMGELLGCTQRLSWLLTRGKHRCDVAIVYPVAAVEADPERGKRAVRCAFETGEYLYAHAVDFDFIDFESVERAKIVNGELQVAGERFLSIVIPDMQAVRFGMIQKLAEFARAGGHVAIIGDSPSASDRIGASDPELASLVNDITSAQPALPDPQALLNELHRRFAPDILLPDGVKSYFQHRILGDEQLYMLYGIPAGTEVGLHATGRPVLLDPFTGAHFALSVQRVQDGYTFIEFDARFAGLMLVLFDSGAETLETLYSGPYRDIDFAGAWQCELAPTLDNRYGDYRLPAFDSYIGAEARSFEYRFDGSDWQKATYSYGPRMLLHRGELDARSLADIESARDLFEPYCFSMRMGVEGDAGYQASYHGLKGRISDDFIALGKKHLTYAGSSSEYTGEGPFYLLTHIRLAEDCDVCFDTGAIPPERFWLDGAEVVPERTRLSQGLHTLLIKYPHGLRTRFVVLRADAPEFRQQVPLAMQWYENPNVIPFDALPELDGKLCEFRFTAPPGMQALILPDGLDAHVYVGDEELTRNGNRHTPVTPQKSAAELRMVIRATDGAYGPALIKEPLKFECGRGEIDAKTPIEAQGLEHYSGGVRYMRNVHIDDTPGRVRLKLGKVECAAQVRVNGEYAGVLVAPPYELDISKWVRTGDNAIDVLVHNTLRNHMRTIPTNFCYEVSPGRD